MSTSDSAAHIESMQFNGLDDYVAIVAWMKASGDTYALADEIHYSTPEMALQTAQGRMSARPGDWIVKAAGGFTVVRSTESMGFYLWRDPRTGAEHALAPEDVTVVTPMPAGTPPTAADLPGQVSSGYDSTADTLTHSLRVGELVGLAIHELVDRSVRHDRSKTEPPELDTFNEFTPKLRDSTYGSDEYKSYLDAMAPALAHHYANNRHHPEFFGEDGVNGMTLVDLVELLADWKAATERHADGDLTKSLRIQQTRFGMSDQLTRILRNTAFDLGWIPMLDGCCDMHSRHCVPDVTGPGLCCLDCTEVSHPDHRDGTVCVRSKTPGRNNL